MKQKRLIATVLSAFLLMGTPSAAMAAQNITVTLPTFPVTLNGYQMQPTYDEYPVIVYKDITYFPMTYHYGGFLGLDTLWANNTLTVKKVTATSKDLQWYEKKDANKSKYTASIATSNIVVNGKNIQNSKEPYPLLLFRDITYFPLTWRFAVDEFGWDYSFDSKNGLKINSKSEIEISGKSENYVISGDIAVGYPSNSYDEQYTFTYKKGTASEKEFSLASKLVDGMYYFNHQVDENGYMQFDTLRKPSIAGNILTLPCVRQNDSTGERENILMKIDFVKGEIVSTTVV